MFSSAAQAAEDREYLNFKTVLGMLMIVRPLEYRTDFKTIHAPEGTDVVFADIAVVDMVDQATGQPGKVFRAQAVLQGYLKGTFKRKVGEMIVGMVHEGPRTKGNAPILWHDLYGDPNAVARATAWVTANQSFLVQLQPSAVAPAVPTYTPPPATGGIVQPGALTRTGENGPPAYVVPVAPVSAAPAPQLTTLDQLRGMQLNHQGQPQPDQAPF